MDKVTLYAKDAAGNLRQWSIRHDDKNIYMSSGMVGGEEIESSEAIHFGLANRTREGQIEMRMKSRINKKLDSGYVHDIDEARNNVRTNSLGYLKAMKCSRYDQEYKKIPYDRTYIQNKLNGHHCSIINDNGTKIAYSNNGKVINSIDHILDGFDLPIGASVEGELYVHNTPLQTISSWVRKKQENSLRLHYYCYDVVMDECYSKRLSFLQNLEYGHHASFLDTALIVGEFDIEPLLSNAIKDNYEGLVLRLSGHPYQPGVRSKGMIKVKPMHFGAFKIDDEFLVVNITPSKDGWAVLHCETEEGKPFKVSCHGTMEYKKMVLHKKDEFIGKHIRVEYSEKTQDKKPFHPVAIEWREKFDE